MYLFVYGTLKRNHHNNHYLEDQEFVKKARTKPWYRLFCNETFPMMIRDKEEGYSVSGEIWEIDEDILDELDEHEVLYDRKLIKIRKFKHPVWAYIYKGKLDNLDECYGSWGN